MLQVNFFFFSLLFILFILQMGCLLEGEGVESLESCASTAAVLGNDLGGGREEKMACLDGRKPGRA